MNKTRFLSAKWITGFSTCFRQWRAEGTHCKFLHGYAISFKVWFTGELDEKNWIQDFGFMKRSKTLMKLWGRGLKGEELFGTPDQWFKSFFDHTVILATDDPKLARFEQLDEAEIIQLRVLSQVGCERFAQFVFEQLNIFLQNEVGDRVRVCKVECFENEQNSAIYEVVTNQLSN